MIYGTQDGWFPPIPGPGPVMLVGYILVLYYVHVQLFAVAWKDAVSWLHLKSLQSTLQRQCSSYSVYKACNMYCSMCGHKPLVY